MINNKSALTLVLCSAVLAGCQSTGKDIVIEPAKVPQDILNVMTSCDNPDRPYTEGVSKNLLYVSGAFTDSYWALNDDRLMQHKGNNIYQLVHEEFEGIFDIQFAKAGWADTYIFENSKYMTTDTPSLMKRGGFAKPSRVEFKESGKYVWSLKLDENGKEQYGMIAKCK
ncbi:hypothetical protein [Vibrio parahaemolyticus]|uniref:hypothetical protein n=1 Tax=Vibrio parahaemolyticus TaxID=670 RepID=UPI001124009A|nr:hypothetical protein [Vibrio parahaemolyticus]TOG33111.1 hypothetical protein CGJ03_23070 [Vibrio parahaemolyticus]HCM1552938.1 hypothetical protein [Vibrio parahaemolyticus]